jgi:hypothetical protein
MPATMAKSFDNPDELRTPPQANVAVVDLNGSKVARLTLAPGWRWSEAIRPIVGTETCQVHHLGVLVSGTMHVVAADGNQYDVGAGSAYVIEPGHDAWVIGSDPVVAFEFDALAAANFAATPTH